MYLWGLTIDTVTCIQLVLAIGLAVDYSAHIGHTFMTVTGSRDGKPLSCDLMNKLPQALIKPKLICIP